MLKILKADDTYRREKEYASLSFLDCTKIKTEQMSRIWIDAMMTRYCLLFVSDGSAAFHINKSKTVVLESDMLLLTPPNTLIAAKAQGQVGTVWMVMFECDDFFFFRLPADGILSTVPGTLTPVLQRIHAHMAHRTKPQYYYDAMLMLILNEIERHIPTQRNKQEVYDRVCKYISDHVAERLTVRSIGAALNYNPDYLCRVLRQCNGSNIKQLVIEEKLSCARSLLQMTGCSCEKIGASIGLSSANKFIKFFKYHTGETPSGFRRTHRIE